MDPLLSLLASWLVVASPAPREEVLAEAQARWAAGDMEGVVDVFDQASAEDPQPEYLFGQARAEVKLGRCQDAVVHLRSFLETEPPGAQRRAAEAELAKCDAVAVEPEPEPEPEPEQPEPEPPRPSALQPPPTSNERPDVQPRRGPTDGLGWGLVGAGGAMALVGATLYGVGASWIASPGGTPDEQAYRDRTRAAQRLGWTGVGVAATGVVVLTGGVVRLLVARRRAGGSTANPVR